MGLSLFTSHTAAVFAGINDLGLPVGVGREEARPGRLAGVLATRSRLREDDGQG